MANEVTVEIKLDADLKAAAEKLYKRIDLTLEEAIPLLVKYNVNQDTKPFDIPEEEDDKGHTELFGALAKYANPAMHPFEDGAWERAVVKKYAKNLG
ncbi:MAG: hypothetical protein IJL12_05595 [Selenomonadaceae bacterium]|nr:hypothetical protein [Selenomonadaceae bacterium]MBQ6131796.1 hypothetical protein [Selenomonadaceae bacterium]MBQ7493746.1 hypothetical protein [Selenomonadaceae bacterium]